METPIVDLKNININHDDKNILSDISLSIKKGEFIYLIGKTGSGKSSLLKILYGNLKILDGEANVVGINIVKIKEKEIPFLRRKLGIVFQDFKLLSDRSIKKNLEFVLRATDWKDKKKIEDRIQTVLEKVKLQNTENKFPHELSGGEQQRIAIARALLNKPELILADEPTGNLDEINTKLLLELILNINRKLEYTFVITSHDMSFKKIANNIFTIDNKKINKK